MMKRVVILVFLFVLLVAAGFIWWRNGTSAVSTHDTSEKIFVIERGAAIREIGNKLKHEGLIRDPVAFFLYLKFENSDKAIQAGDYKLSPAMDLPKIIENLKHGTLDFWVTFPEGMRAEEYASLLKERISTYDQLWVAELVKNEGYLFPDTYLIPKDASVDTVISLMRNNFNKKVEQDIPELLNASQAVNLRKTVILASLIEREAKTDAEKPIIAGILTNRLNVGMALQVDATIQYAKGYNKMYKTWWRPVTLEEYKSIDSLYNTYLHAGLPPGPISNPGIEAIKAAGAPADTPYVYYLHDRKGQIHYAKTVQEHNRNVQEYLK